MKFVCTERGCGWTGDKPLVAPHPFAEGEILGCPKCLEAGTLRNGCDEEGCNQPSSCGFPTASGYRMTCDRHMPKMLHKTVDA